MSFLSSFLHLFLLLLCLSIHACNGRLLHHHRALDKHSNGLVHSSTKDDEISIPLSDVKVQGLKTMKKQARNQNSHGRLSGETSSTQMSNQVKETKNISQGVAKRKSLGSVSWRIPRKKQVMGIAGSEIIISSNVGLQQTAKNEVEKQGRSLLGPKYHVTEETLDSKENGVDGDVVDMDYDTPHRKPPIHNLSP